MYFILKMNRNESFELLFRKYIVNVQKRPASRDKIYVWAGKKNVYHGSLYLLVTPLFFLAFLKKTNFSFYILFFSAFLLFIYFSIHILCGEFLLPPPEIWILGLRFYSKIYRQFELYGARTREKAWTDLNTLRSYSESDLI